MSDLVNIANNMELLWLFLAGSNQIDLILLCARWEKYDILRSYLKRQLTKVVSTKFLQQKTFYAKSLKKESGRFQKTLKSYRTKIPYYDEYKIMYV